MLEQPLEAAGFFNPTKIEHFNIDSRLICALLERWRPETHTFLFPTGECTITLEDIHMLLGLKVDGLPVTTDTKVGWNNVFDILGKNVDEEYKKRYFIKLIWLENYMVELASDQRPEMPIYFFRVYCLYLIGKLLFPDSNSNLVHIKWLAILDKDPVEIGTYSWGSACLAYLYRGLCDGAYNGVHKVAGCTQLVQAWAYSRITNIAPVPRNDIHQAFSYTNK